MWKRRKPAASELVTVAIEVDGRGSNSAGWDAAPDGRPYHDDPRRSSGYDIQQRRESVLESRGTDRPSSKRSCLAWLPKQAICTAMDHWPYQILILVLVLYSLFAYNLVVCFNAPNSVDPYTNALLILCMTVFGCEITLSILCRDRPAWFLLSLDALATASIVVDLTWVAHAAGMDNTNGSKTSSAAMVSARAGRIIRLVRLLRLLRIVSLLSTVAKRAMQRRKAADAGEGGAANGAPSNIGGKLTDAMTVQVALVVILTAVATALISSWSVQPAAYDAYLASFHPLLGQPREAIEPQVQAMASWAAAHLALQPLLTLRVGSERWSWLDAAGTYPPRTADLAVFNSPDSVPWNASIGGTPDGTTGLVPAVVLETDSSGMNRHDAVMDMLLILLVLMVLLGYVAAVNVTIYRTLVHPLERIFNTIRNNAAQVVAALGPDDSPEEATSNEDGDIATIEAAVQKMSRIISHVSAPGGQGSHVARTLALGADDSTKDWLATMVGDGVRSGGAAQGDTGARGSVNAVPSPPPAGPAARPPPAPVLMSKRSSLASFESATSSTPGRIGGALAGVKDAVRSVRFPVLGGADSAAAAAAAVAAAHFDAARASNGSVATAGTADPASRPGTGSFSGLGGGARSAALASFANFGGGLTEAQRDALLAVDVDALHSFRLDVLALGRAQIAPLVITMFLELGLVRFSASDPPPGPTPPANLDEGRNAGVAGPWVDAAVLWRFVEEVSTFYRDTPYHNFSHCADVTHATFLLINRLKAVAKLTQVECFALMVAALAHDMDHPGVNNMFLVSSRDALALTYNDASVLENRHVACLYALVAAKPEVDVFASLDAPTWKEVRRLVIAAVLHTDMTQHFPMVSKLEVFLELRHADIQAAHAAQRQALRSRTSAAAAAGGLTSTMSLTNAAAAAYSAAPELPSLFGAPEERVLLVQLLLHCADISNPARPAAIAEKWADCVLGEFFAQGDRERGAGQPISPMCDRATTSRPTSQVNFIEFVVAPLFAALARIFPDAGELIENAAACRQFWQMELVAELAADGSKSEEERAADVAKSQARAAAFQDKYREVMGVVTKRKRDMRRRLSTAAGGPTLASAPSESASAHGGVARVGSVNAGVVPVAPQSARSSGTSASHAESGRVSRKGSESSLAAAGSPISPHAAPLPPRDRHPGPKLSGSASEMAAAVAAAMLSRTRSTSGRGAVAMGFTQGPRQTAGERLKGGGMSRMEGAGGGEISGSDLV